MKLIKNINRLVKLIVINILLFPAILLAEEYTDFISQADALYARLNLEGYKKSMPLYEKAVKLQSDSYEANWKCARSYARYAAAFKWANYEARAKGKNPGEWRKISARLGDRGMTYAIKAQELASRRVEGQYWLVRCIFARVEGVNWFTMIRENFLPKSKNAIMAAYDIDKSYFDFAPVFMRANFYIQPPWPFKDREKALKYYKEYKEFENLLQNVEEKDERGCFGAEALLQMKGDEFRQEARILFESSTFSKERYLSDWAKSLLNKHFGTNYNIDKNAAVGVGK